MAAWKSTFAHSDDNESFDSEYEDEDWSPEQRENSSDTTESDLAELSSVATAKSKSSTSRKPGRKGNGIITEMVDIICSSEHLRKELKFKNTSRSRNTAFYTDVVKQLKERLASRGENFRLGASQQLFGTTFESTVALQSCLSRT